MVEVEYVNIWNLTYHAVKMQYLKECISHLRKALFKMCKALLEKKTIRQK